VSEKKDMADGTYGMIVELINERGESFTVEITGFKTQYNPSGFKNNFAVWTDIYNSFNIRYLIVEKIAK
jgi:hypothetical protein